MSSAILYLAIVAIWAGVLVPRWLRREPHREAAPRSRRARAARAPDTGHADADAAGDAAAGEVRAAGRRAEDPGEEDPRSGRRIAAGRHTRSAARRRAMAARRRLFGILVALAFAAVTIAAAGLAAWWVAAPPVGMLAGYMVLLREVAHADAALRRTRGAYAAAGGSARGRAGAHAASIAASPTRVAVGSAGAAVGSAGAAVGSAHGFESVPGSVADGGGAESADVVDITARVDDELYDQYADAKLRAVGD